MCLSWLALVRCSVPTTTTATEGIKCVQLKVSILGWICISLSSIVLFTALVAWFYCLWKGCCDSQHQDNAPAETQRNVKDHTLNFGDIGEAFTVDDETHWSILASPTHNTPLLQPCSLSSPLPETSVLHGANDTLTRPQSAQLADHQRCLCNCFR